MTKRQRVGENPLSINLGGKTFLPVACPYEYGRYVDADPWGDPSFDIPTATPEQPCSHVLDAMIRHLRT
ncbi:hypothetical protein ColTof4_13822 [Colletotrichum tofieldiae]|nr:hypothetical protein ColTof3_01727 [Colletotrichum tofieldiae]GKT81399.1 hypothetical protein ColTof4_13822 [Colletotrichum tofieldiae]